MRNDLQYFKFTRNNSQKMSTWSCCARPCMFAVFLLGTTYYCYCCCHYHGDYSHYYDNYYCCASIFFFMCVSWKIFGRLLPSSARYAHRLYMPICIFVCVCKFMPQQYLMGSVLIFTLCYREITFNRHKRKKGMPANST